MSCEVKKELVDRYAAAAHAMQSAVAFMIAVGDTGAEPKHLRVGVNMAMCETGALAKTLTDAGLIKFETFYENLVELLEKDVADYVKKAEEKGYKGVNFG